MTKTAMQMIGEARAQVGWWRRRRRRTSWTPVPCSSTCASPKSGSTATSTGRWRRPGGYWSSSPTHQPRHNQALDPGRRVIVVCASGARASLAALTLKTMGYGDVAILDGGLKGWTEAGLPTNEHEYSGI
jgi:3-mercaptopyruvate sulfurtransferase SseA